MTSRSPGMKRIMREAKELANATYDYHARPMDDNVFEWHFTIRGPRDSVYDGGIYHGIIRLPSEYPLKPPSIIINTKNGRFEVGKRICLSMSDYHPETWQPAWTIRTVLLALIAFFPTPGNGAVGSVRCTDEERKKLARRSVHFECEECGKVCDLLLKERETAAKKSSDDEAIKEILEAEEKIAREKGKKMNTTEGEDKDGNINNKDNSGSNGVSGSQLDREGTMSDEDVMGRILLEQQLQEAQHQLPGDKWKFDVILYMFLALVFAILVNKASLLEMAEV
eukprot:m.10394 g.10394  ORF g.10394 m.10394 type:complete len:281 (+) comp6587_c0_seq1:44-886(+)